MNVPQCLAASTTSSRFSWRSAEDHLWSQDSPTGGFAKRTEQVKQEVDFLRHVLRSAASPALIWQLRKSATYHLSQVGENGEMK